MEVQCDRFGVVDLLLCPAFYVRDRKIVRVNDAAKRQFLEPGTEILPLLVSGREEYEQFQNGYLCLTMRIAGQPQGVTVTAREEGHIFLVDQEQELQELQVLALAAQELRLPLSNAMISVSQLTRKQTDPELEPELARLNRGMAQTLRMVCNMSDALRYAKGWHPETRNLTALIREIFEKAGTLLENTGIQLTYQGISEDIYALTDAEQLERAILNLLSNALKFSDTGGSIRAELTKKGSVLRLSVEDSGCGLSSGAPGNLFTRYLREPSLEDSRQGLGLGLVLVRAAAANHGGTVLVDQPGKGLRVTMTLAIRDNPENLFRSDTLSVDYTGGRDHQLQELSEKLPAELYCTGW